MPNPVLITATKNNATIAAANTSVSVTSTGSVTTGHLQIVCIEISGASAPTGISPPAGWTTLLATTTTQASGLVSAAIFYKLATATGAFSGSFSWTTSSTGGEWLFMEWSGAGAALIDGAATTTLNTSSTSPVSPTITPSAGNINDTLVGVLFGGVLGTSTVAIPGGMSSILAVNGSASTPVLGAASLNLSSASATGSKTWTLGTAEAALGVSFLIAPTPWVPPDRWPDSVSAKAGTDRRALRGKLSVPFFQVWFPPPRWDDFTNKARRTIEYPYLAFPVNFTGPPTGVVFDAQSSVDANGTGATSFTDSTNLTVGSHPNRALVVLIAWSTVSPPTGVSITWAGQSLSLISNTSIGNGIHGNVAIYGLLGPTTGTQTLAGSWTGARDFNVAGVSFYNVDQTTFATSFINGTTATGAGGAGSPNTVTVTSTTADYTVAIFATDGSFSTVTNGTQVFQDNSRPAISGQGIRAPGAATVTLAGTNNQAWSGAGVDIVFSPAAPVNMGWFIPFEGPSRRILTPVPDWRFLSPPAQVWFPPDVYSDIVPVRKTFLAYEQPLIAQQLLVPAIGGGILWYQPWSAVMRRIILIGAG